MSDYDTTATTDPDRSIPYQQLEALSLLEQQDCQKEIAAQLLASFPDGVLSVIMECAGPGHFRFVAGTCRQWKVAYIQQFRSRDTTMHSVTESTSRCQLYLQEQPKEALPSVVPVAKMRVGEFAALYGRLQVLQWVWQMPMKRNWSLCDNAAKNGHLETLQWLCEEQNASSSSLTCAHAALNGHIHVLKWASDNGCPWDWRTCASAAKGGHLDILKWARDHGCDWDGMTCSKRQHMGIWKYCNGPEKMVVPGTTGFVSERPGMGTWTSSNGLDNMVVHGMHWFARLPLEMGTGNSFNGHLTMVARPRLDCSSTNNRYRS